MSDANAVLKFMQQGINKTDMIVSYFALVAILFVNRPRLQLTGGYCFWGTTAVGLSVCGCMVRSVGPSDKNGPIYFKLDISNLHT